MPLNHWTAKDGAIAGGGGGGEEEVHMVGLNLKGQHLNPLGLTHVVEDAAQALGHPADLLRYLGIQTAW